MVRKVMVSVMFFSLVGRSSAQSFELQQLILNVEKLMQFKQILSDMKAGYDILTQGYNAVKDISEGNFSLHQTFLDGLLAVSPTVRKYKKIAECLTLQVNLVKAYKAAWKDIQASNLFKERELDYIQSVYQHLLKTSLHNLDDLTSVLTAGKLRMSDHERLAVIDRVHKELEDEYHFLKVFNSQNTMLLLQRSQVINEAKGIEKIYFDK